jgi:hypothetical protein
MVPALTTVTLTVVLPMPVPLAVIVAEPWATPVTGTLTVLEPEVKLTVAGTVAAAVLDDCKLTVTPETGAGAERFSVRF